MAYSVLLKILVFCSDFSIPRGAMSSVSRSPTVAYSGFSCVVYNFDLGRIVNIFLLLLLFSLPLLLRPRMGTLCNLIGTSLQNDSGWLRLAPVGPRAAD